MLASRSSGAFVCLRCEFRLARRPLSSFGCPTSVARFSTSARQLRNGPQEEYARWKAYRRRYGKEEDYATWEAMKRERDAKEAEEEGESPVQQPSLQLVTEGPALNRIRRRQGKVVRETSEKLLGLMALGDDAEILVLQDVTNDALADEPAAQLEERTPVEVPDIHASLQEEGEELTIEEIHAQIDSLRPRVFEDPEDTQYMTKFEFGRTYRILANGFTHHHMSTYLSAWKRTEDRRNYEKKVQDRIDQKNGKGPADRMIPRSTWQPGITSIHHRSSLVSPLKRRATDKDRLADRIMRLCWKVVVLDDLEVIGELEMALKPWQITLLNAGEKDRILDKIGTTRRAKLEVFKNMLRITADITTADYAANDVEESLKKTETKKLNLRPWVSSLDDEKVQKKQKLNNIFTKSDLERISKVTRTSIDDAGGALLVIKGFDMNSIEEAERALLRLLPLKGAKQYTIDTRSTDAAKDSIYLLPVFAEEKILGHTGRNANFGRKTLPITRTILPDIDEGLDSHTDVVDEPVKLPKKTQDQVNRVVSTLKRPAEEEAEIPEEVGSWTPEPQYQLHAEFGQVLFPQEDPKPSTTTSTPISTSPQPFVPNFPGLASLLASPSFTTTTRMQSPSLVYDFIPAHEQATFKPGQQFPTLHIQMRTGRNGAQAALHKISLRFQHRIHDVLLPDKAVDVRFIRYGRLRFRKSHADKQVHKWTEAVIANIESGERLTAPSLRIDIPEWTIPGFPADATGMRTVSYLFSGIQFRQSVAGNFLGNTVSFSTVQSGKLGARGGVLTSHYDADVDTGCKDEEGLNGFVQRCLGVAGKITEAAGQTGRVSKTVNARDEGGERRMKRAERQAQGEDQGLEAVDALSEAGLSEGGDGVMQTV